MCEQCNRPIVLTVNRSNRRFCSDKCRAAWWNRNKSAAKIEEAAAFLESITEPTSCSVEILVSGKTDLGDGITGYIANMAIAGVMLNRKLISKQEFLNLEKQMLEKYGIPENSIYRDYRIVKVQHTSAGKRD